MPISEVARIREEIATAYMAAQLGLSGLSSGSTRHQFITAHQERIGILHEQLHSLVGGEAIAMVAETLAALSEYPTRSDVIRILRSELGQTEETEHWVDWIQDMWETQDKLIERFGLDAVKKIINLPSSSTTSYQPS